MLNLVAVLAEMFGLQSLRQHAAQSFYAAYTDCSAALQPSLSCSVGVAVLLPACLLLVQAVLSANVNLFAMSAGVGCAECSCC